MDRLRRLSKIALVALTIVLAGSAVSEARGPGGHGSAGHSGGFAGQHGFEGHHFDGRRFDGRHFARHDFGVRGGFAFVPVFPYYGYYPYDYPLDGSQSYWYYCPSYGAYYPNVATCPENWVPVPAS